MDMQMLYVEICEQAYLAALAGDCAEVEAGRGRLAHAALQVAEDLHHGGAVGGLHGHAHLFALLKAAVLALGAGGTRDDAVLAPVALVLLVFAVYAAQEEFLKIEINTFLEREQIKHSI